MNKLKQILHFLPWVHFYRWGGFNVGKYIDTGSPFYSQIKICEICRKHKVVVKPIE